MWFEVRPLRFRFPSALIALAMLAAGVMLGAQALAYDRTPKIDSKLPPFSRLGEAGTHWTFLQSNCVACHNAESKMGGLVPGMKF